MGRKTQPTKPTYRVIRLAWRRSVTQLVPGVRVTVIQGVCTQTRVRGESREFALDDVCFPRTGDGWEGATGFHVIHNNHCHSLAFVAETIDASDGDRVRPRLNHDMEENNYIMFDGLEGDTRIYC